MGARPILALAAVLAGGCERPTAARAIDPSLVAISPRVTIRTDAVGVDRFASQATFALVDAENLGDVDAEVTLGGILVDGDGREVAPLRPESLRVPAHGRRTFALVDRGRAARPTATAARVELRGARAAQFAAAVTITEPHIYRDGDRAVVAGQVANTSDRPCIAMVLAGFHDRDGRPMTRPFAAFELGGNATRPTRFVGPDGSSAGYIFVGDVTYCPRSGCTVERVAPKLW
ncbi:MAG: hypothetical protein IPL61_14635 [Myxococcales bacterium]|nr:hypothetical protein [Myxococcales bacterium]